MSSSFKGLTPGKVVLIFGVGFMHFSLKMLTSLANNFSMQNSIFKNSFGRKIFICKPIFKIFAAHFRTKGVLNHDKIIIV